VSAAPEARRVARHALVAALLIGAVWLLAASVLAPREVLAQEEEPTPTPSPRVLPLTPVDGQIRSTYGLYDVLELLPDPTGEWTIADVASPARAGEFRRNDTLEASLARGTRAVWLRLTVDSELPLDETWWLYFGQWGVVELYAPTKDGYTCARSGRFVPLAERPGRDVHPYIPMLPVVLPAGPRHAVFLIRLADDLRLAHDLRGAPETVSGTLFRRPYATARATTRVRVYLEGAFLGVMLALAVYHLVLFALVRERCSLSFALTALALAIVPNGLHGFHLEFVWPSWPRWDFYFGWFFRPLWLIPFYLFLTDYLATARHTPRAHRVLRVLMATALLDPLFLYLKLHIYPTLNAWILVACLLAPLVVAILRVRQGSQEARVFLVGFGLLLVAEAGYLAARFGFVSSSTLAEHGAQLGFAGFAVLFGLALAVQIRRLRTDTLLAEHREALRAAELAQHEIEAATLSDELARARLHDLKAQLQPHFLFSALDSVAALMRQDARLAERKLALLADLLRLSLEEREGNEIPLAKEKSFVQRYLEIEKTRFGGRLQVEWEVASETLDALVPHLILQPLAENAVERVVASGSAGVTVAVGARREGETLRLEVRDDAAGGNGTLRTVEEMPGLANTRLRLAQLYGLRASLTLTSDPLGGLLAALELPFHTTAWARED
jgi:hypothetical protein